MSFKSALGATLSATTLLVAGASLAQQPTNPLDVVPDKMPFDVPYGAPISLARSETVIHAALAESTRRGWKLICGVVDAGGNLVAFQRQDGAQLASIDIAIHKARTAAKFRRETRLLENGVQAGMHYLVTLDDVIASRGGIPLVDEGKMIGAIGCSGGTGSQDEVVAKAGVAGLK
jgi:uncharacterized protein GlcG (DUF336 family)